MVGFGALFLALIATAMVVFYEANAYLSNKTKRSSSTGGEKKRFIWHLVPAAFIGISAVYLLFIILANKFEYAYVFSYSSRELEFFYKISAFWAGQEGSFLLWLVFHAVFGLVLIKRQKAPSETMIFYSLLQVLLIIILLAKNPFMMLSELFENGNGLNPLLQDPWMVIHPPVIFFGYAGLAVPFAYALGGLLAEKHEQWVARALPWTLFSWAALGAGIFIGGFWAYKVLGWGGYWAWDPVENSSLVPWLAASALLHLLLLARIRPAAVKPAYLASIFSFLFVLYGTYLTRSGILSDFSTHSFADGGIGSLLAGCIFIVAIASFALFSVRFSGLPSGDLYPQVKSREFILSAVALVFAIFGVLVFVGMSTPLLTLLLGKQQNVSVQFYNSTNLPIAVALAVLLTLSPAVRWGANKDEAGRKMLFMAIPFAVVGTAWAWAYNIHNIFMLLAVGFSLAGLFTNLFAAARKEISWAVGIAHAGVALMIMGIMFSSAASESKIISFAKGETHTIFGEQITYQGKEIIVDGSGFYQTFLLGDNGKKKISSLTKLNGDGRQAAREPGIDRRLEADFYIAPLTKTKNDGQEFILRKGEKTVQEGLEITLSRLSMHNLEGDNNKILIQAELEVWREGQKRDVVPEMVFHKGHLDGQPVNVFEQFEITLVGVNPNDGAIRCLLNNLLPTDKVELLDVEISRKPLINLVWLGAVLIVAGTCLAGYKRSRVRLSKELSK